MNAVVDSVEALQEGLRRRAVALGLCAEGAGAEDTASAIEALLEREIRVPAPSDEECRRWYEANPRAFTEGERVAARHILFAVTPRTPLEPLRRKAEETLLDLRTRPELFAARARDLSNCSSGAAGGDLGELGRGDCVPEFESALFGEAGCGVLPTLVRTRYGFHVVMVERRVEGRRLAFDAVHGRIAMRLRDTALRNALTQYGQALLA
jgi:peptidyl-prolyl cis-trans isomerase C